MKSENALTTRHKDMSWGRPILIIGGLVWIVRAGMEIILHPDYWDPQTAVDYTAVAGTSLSYFLLALGIWAVHTNRGETSSLRRWVWRVGVILSCGGAVVGGLANLVEDWLRIPSFGEVFILSGVAVFVGLLMAGSASLWPKQPSRWTGLLLLICAVGWSLPDSGGGLLVGISLILLGLVQWR